MKRHKIVVIEDEPDILENLRFNLEREGFEVACAADGVTGLDVVRRECPDLVLLDLLLPGLGGLEVCRTLKSEPATSKIPIIMVTAKGEEADNEQLGGEPSLTEKPKAAGDEEAAEDASPEPAAAPDCDLDCIEAELDAQEEKERQKTGVLKAGEESGSLTADVGTADDAGDSMASEPSTTSLSEAAPPGADERKLPLRLGPVRLKQQR